MYEFPRGLTFVKTDGNVLYLCSSKCRKNMEMKKRKVRWISKSSANPHAKKAKKVTKKKVTKAKKAATRKKK
jgi:ribosomal protein L24E